MTVTVGGPRPLVIVGAGGHGREVLDIVEALERTAAGCGWHVVGFVADAEPDLVLLERREVPYLGPVAELADTDADYVLGIGDPQARARLDRQISAWGRQPATLVHPSATLGGDNDLGAGVVLAAGARVTTNVHLGRHTHLNIGAVVSHDARIGDHVTVSPGVYINGSVHVGDRAFLGTGAILLPGITVGADAVVAAGAVVVGDVGERTTVAGVPARNR